MNQQPTTAEIELNSLIDTAILAKMLSVSQTSLIHARGAGKSPIPYIKVGRLVRYKFADVLAYIAAKPIVKA